MCCYGYLWILVILFIGFYLLKSLEKKFRVRDSINNRVAIKRGKHNDK